MRCGGFTPDGKLVVTGGGEGDDSLKVWDPKSGACLLSVMDAHTYHTAGQNPLLYFNCDILPKERSLLPSVLDPLYKSFLKT